VSHEFRRTPVRRLTVVEPLEDDQEVTGLHGDGIR
jgi:hypothetical protein